MSEWIEWSGGECPVGGDEFVEVELRNGKTSSDRAINFAWWCEPDEFDIVRYRVLPAPEFARPKRDGLADADLPKTLRADFRKVRCKQGETFEQAEARLFLEARDAFNEAIQEARRIVEQIGLTPFRRDQSAADYFDAVIADFVGDTWAVDPRAED